MILSANKITNPPVDSFRNMASLSQKVMKVSQFRAPAEIIPANDTICRPTNPENLGFMTGWSISTNTAKLFPNPDYYGNTGGGESWLALNRRRQRFYQKWGQDVNTSWLGGPSWLDTKGDAHDDVNGWFRHWWLSLMMMLILLLKGNDCRWWRWWCLWWYRWQ